jgi:hypothetical protein
MKHSTEFYVGLASMIVFIILFFWWLIHLDNQKPKYEIKYIHGWFVVVHKKTQETISPRFTTEKRATEWYNENCI